MRASLSVATKVFLGFAVVIVAFGATCAYTLLTMGELRQTVTVVWKEVIPISNQLKTLSRQLKNAEEFLALKRPSDLQWIQNILPSLEPFNGPQGLLNAATRLDALATGGEALSDADRRELAAIAERLTGFADGKALSDAIAGEGVDDLADAGAVLASDELYERLLRRTLKKASLGELTGQAPEARASVRALRRLNRELSDVIRALGGPIEAIDRRVTDDERRATLYVLVIASGALLLSLAMLWITLRTLRPIQRLRAGARRIAAGDYQDRVSVGSRDEIGQLALEFNTMAESLQNRDAELERQREALLRAERLAVIGKLAAQITHEVRNPLSSIGLNAELLEDELDELSDPAEARASLHAINAEVQRLKSITEEYLHFARLPKPELGSVDVGRLL
ncbi:MAG: HAMP domain-containing protein, partial [Myxococcales bacterium]|nr:HAMP domain-containing protein [Myxococcales bacterium]